MWSYQFVLEQELAHSVINSSNVFPQMGRDYADVLPLNRKEHPMLSFIMGKDADRCDRIPQSPCHNRQELGHVVVPEGKGLGGCLTPKWETTPNTFVQGRNTEHL